MNKIDRLYNEVIRVRAEAMSTQDSEDLLDASEEIKALKKELAKYGEEEIADIVLASINDRIRFLAEFS